MKLDVKGLAFAVGGAWAAGIACVGLANLAWPSYGVAFLSMLSSVYPGYTPGGFSSVVTVTLYGAIDGAVCGAILALIYNSCARSS